MDLTHPTIQGTAQPALILEACFLVWKLHTCASMDFGFLSCWRVAAACVWHVTQPKFVIGTLVALVVMLGRVQESMSFFPGTAYTTAVWPALEALLRGRVCPGTGKQVVLYSSCHVY